MKTIALIRLATKLGFCLVILLALNLATAATPTLLTPSNGGTYSAANQTFEWESDGTEYNAYALTVGTNEGADNVHNSGVLGEDARTYTVESMGSADTLDVRFWFRNRDGLWDYSASTVFNAAAVFPPSIFIPEEYSQLDANSMSLSWRDNGTNVNRYWLYVGSSAGARDYLSQSVNSATSYTVDNLPTDGSEIWVRLWYYTNGWDFHDHQYTAMGDSSSTQNNIPEMTSPVEGSLLTRSEVTFQWQNNNFVPDNYWIYIGTSLGSSNIHSSGALETANEYTYSPLPMGEETLYVRLWYNDGSWQYSDYKYSSKLYGEAQLVWPTPGATIETDGQTFEWSANGQSYDNFQLVIGRSQGSNDFYDSGVLSSATQSVLADNLDQNVEFLYATLRYRVSDTWQEQYFRYRRPFFGGFDEPFDADISRWIESNGTWYNGDLQRLSTSVGDNYAIASYAAAEYSDLDFSARVRRSDKEDNPTFLSIRDSGASSSIECWCANDGCYTFEISPAQNYAVWSCQSSNWVQIKELEYSELINPGNAWNEMRVLAENNVLSFFINDSLAWQGSDDTHTSGSVGIGLVNFSDENPISLDVEWARLSIPGTSSNLSLTGSASQSSTSSGGLASFANDGNSNGVFNNQSVSHTDYQRQPWWQIDLQKKSVLENVRLHNRTDCCSSRLSDVNIFVSDSDMSSRTFSELQADGNVYHYLLAGELNTITEQKMADIGGRYVRVQLSDTNYLSLAEVEVIGR